MFNQLKTCTSRFQPVVGTINRNQKWNILRLMGAIKVEIFMEVFFFFGR